MSDDTRAAQIAGHIGEVLRLLGLDPEVDPEIEGTPERVAVLARDLVSGLGAPPALEPLPHEGVGQGLLIARGVPFYSLCAHHLLPFFGAAHIGYVPRRRIVGIGAIARTLEHFSRRPQLQERLGEQVAEHLERETEAEGVIVVLEARQLCMEMRGERKRAVIETVAARGTLAEGDLRREFFDRLARGARGAEPGGA
jgi:GTP cyclohydrolase I